MAQSRRSRAHVFGRAVALIRLASARADLEMLGRLRMPIKALSGTI